MEDIKSKGKFLALILRHKPETINIKLDKQGWAQTQDLINSGKFTMEDLEMIVELNDKGRFKFNVDNTKIRALQGHSIKVDLELKATQPPSKLYHGTSRKFSRPIINNGIQKRSREYVHLSADKDTAINVGKRRDQNPRIFVIDAERMYNDGHKFYLSENGIWLTNYVPPKYLNR